MASATYYLLLIILLPPQCSFTGQVVVAGIFSAMHILVTESIRNRALRSMQLLLVLLQIIIKCICLASFPFQIVSIIKPADECNPNYHYCVSENVFETQMAATVAIHTIMFLFGCEIKRLLILLKYHNKTTKKEVCAGNLENAVLANEPLRTPSQDKDLQEMKIVA
ncbi:hypothetical protein L5515_017719 [Caenorhabditis briggsae]|uniref:Uncharacterized protein n=1 Tax=Caenorhabditis briggsae TaxID=6238 RepID=A0AAE9FEG4_CAEBR|nr:hypothetical protein L5515_017719 [Caenorhabditis briggsae]